MQPTSVTTTNSAVTNPLATENMKEVATAGGLIGSIGRSPLTQLLTAPSKNGFNVAQLFLKLHGDKTAEKEKRFEEEKAALLEKLAISDKENGRLKMENGELTKEVAESKQQIEKLQELNSNQQKRRNVNIEALKGLIASMSNEGDSLEVKMEETPNGKQLSTSPQKKSKAQKRTLPLEKDQQEKKQKTKN